MTHKRAGGYPNREIPCPRQEPWAYIDAGRAKRRGPEGMHTPLFPHHTLPRTCQPNAHPSAPLSQDPEAR